MKMEARELVQELKKGILMWYPFEEEKKTIVIDRTNRDSLFEMDGDYDYMIVTSDWEREENPTSFFTLLSGKLRNTGKLFILMNNRLGLRYFCGDKDRYSDSVIDCLEDYRNCDMSGLQGRMYDKAQMKRILKEAGLEKFQFFSVLSDLENPSLIFAEDYFPNENLTNRVIATYNSPDTVFVEEKTLYQPIVDNGMLSGLANAYLVECTKGADLCDVLHVTSSLERGNDNALFTIIHKSGIVEKKAAYTEGIKRLSDINDNHNRLKKRGIKVVEGSLEGDRFCMPYFKAETAQLYLGRILRNDTELFVREMDRFRDHILQSSEIVSPDQHDGEGAILQYGFLDMVPLNCFHTEEGFVFFDQEFCVPNYQANILIWRLVASFYAADMEADQIYPREKLLERYDLLRNLSKWQNTEWDFLKALRNEKILEKYHQTVRANKADLLSNRVRMNQSAEYVTKKHMDIFGGIDGKKLILFGTGKYATLFVQQYGNDFPIYAMLDNNAEKVGKKVNGIMVYSPDYLHSLPLGSYKVMICVKKYETIELQLQSMGVNEYSIFDPTKYYQTRPRTSMQVLDVRENAGESKLYHIGYVAGAFDMFHIGHLNLIRRAKERCDYLIVGVMSDEKMFQLKQKYPVIPCYERMQIVAGCRYVDQVEELPLGRAGIRDAYHMFHFDCMFSGDDHSTHKGWLDDQAYLRSLGSDIVFVPYTKEQSSTEIRKKMQE